MELNVIVRNQDNVVEKIIKLKYDAKKYVDLGDLSNYLEKKYKVGDLFYECEFDIDCKKNYIYSLAKKKNKLDLDIDFENLIFNDYYRITKSNSLTINSILLGGGYGNCEDLFLLLQIILFAWDLLKRLVNFVKLLMVYVIPFYHLKRDYGYGKNFIYDIIVRNDTWLYGFFKLDKIKFNKLLEKSVMHKFGYKLKGKKWVKDEYPNSYRHLNKYDKF